MLYDRNQFYYKSNNGTKDLILTLSRVSSIPQNGGEKVSRIQSVSVILTEDVAISGQPLLSAQWEQDGTMIYLTAEGLDRGEFITILKELI